VGIGVVPVGPQAGAQAGEQAEDVANAAAAAKREAKARQLGVFVAPPLRAAGAVSAPAPNG